MIASLRSVALALLVLLAIGHPARANVPFQERLPGYDGYCPLIVRPGETVTLRVSVANSSPATARGTLTEIQLPPGLVLDEGSVRVVPGAGAGRFLAHSAGSAAAGMAWASTDGSDEWRSYTLVLTARVSDGALGELLAVSRSLDSAGRLIRRVDGVVYAQPGPVRATPATTTVDMGVPEFCAIAPTATPTPTATLTPTVTPTPTATPSPTATPVPPPYFVKRLAIADVEGTSFSLAIVCVTDPGLAVKRPPAAEYQIAFELPPGARVALAFGSNPNVAGDGRSARFSIRPGSSGVQAAIASRPAAGEPASRTPIVPGIRVSADGFGGLSERSAEAGAACEADPALLPALRSAERASQAARAANNAGAAEITAEPVATAPVATREPAATVAPTASRAATLVAGPSASTRAPDLASGEPLSGAILPDPRAIMLPLVCGVGIALAALAFAFIAHRRGGDA